MPLPTIPFRWSLTGGQGRKESGDSDDQSRRDSTSSLSMQPSLYVSFPRDGEPGLVNAINAHLGALTDGKDSNGVPLCPILFDNEIGLFLETTGTMDTGTRLQRLEAIQKGALGTLVFLSNSYYGSEQCLRELKQAKTKPALAIVLDAGLGAEMDSKRIFDKRIKPYCDKEYKDFRQWHLRAGQARAFIGTDIQVPIANIKFSSFTCSKCERKPSTVCHKCSTFERHMDNHSFTSSVTELARLINELTPTLREAASTTLLTPHSSSNSLLAQHSTPQGGGSKRSSLTTSNPRFGTSSGHSPVDMDVEMEMDADEPRSSGSIAKTMLKKMSMPSWGRHKTKHEADSFFGAEDSVMEDIGAVKRRLKPSDMYTSVPGEKEKVIFISTNENDIGKPNVFPMPDASDREKGMIYIVDGARKKWDGRQWRRLCCITGCGSAARGSTNYCVAHGREHLGSDCLPPRKSISSSHRRSKSGSSGHRSRSKSRSHSRSRSGRSHSRSHSRSRHRSSHRGHHKGSSSSNPAYEAAIDMDDDDIYFQKYSSFRSKKKTRKGGYSSYTCDDVHCRLPAVSGMHFCERHLKRCHFLTALGDTCGNQSYPNCDGLCYMCWCYVNHQSPDPEVVGGGKTHGISPTMISPIASSIDDL